MKRRQEQQEEERRQQELAKIQKLHKTPSPEKPPTERYDFLLFPFLLSLPLFAHSSCVSDDIHILVADFQLKVTNACRNDPRLAPERKLVLQVSVAIYLLIPKTSTAVLRFLLFPIFNRVSRRIYRHFIAACPGPLTFSACYHAVCMHVLS